MSAYNPSLVTLKIAYFLVLVELAVGDFKLLILHTNDMHSRWTGVDANGGPIEDYLSPHAKYGGYLRLKAKIDEIKSGVTTDEFVLLMNAGDSSQGSPWYSCIKQDDDKAQMTADFVHALGFDAISPGNHEFDLGIPPLVVFHKTAGYNKNPSTVYLKYSADCDEDASQLGADETKWQPIDVNDVDNHTGGEHMSIFIAANVIVGQNSPLYGKIRKSVVRIFPTSDGKRIPVGIIGYLTQETNDSDDVTIGDEVKYVAKEARRLTAMGINIIIALGHSGIDIDIEIAALPHIDVVVGGHSNTFMYNRIGNDVDAHPEAQVQPFRTYPILVPQLKSGQVIGYTTVVQAFAYTKYLGRLLLDFNEDGKVVLESYTDLATALTTFTKCQPVQNPILLTGDIIIVDGPLSNNPGDKIQFGKGSDDTNLLDRWRKIFNEQRDLPDMTLATIDSYLEGGDICRKKECELGRIIADSQRVKFESIKKFANTPDDVNVFRDLIGIVTSGSIRTSIGDIFLTSDNPKTITTWDVLCTLGFKGDIGMVPISRDSLIDVFRYAITEWELADPTGKLLQVSKNLQIIYNFKTIHTWPFEKKTFNIPHVMVKVKDGDTFCDISGAKYAKTKFLVVTSSFLGMGKGGFTMFKEGVFSKPITQNNRMLLKNHLQNLKREGNDRLLFLNKKP